MIDVSFTPSVGSYDESGNVWSIGDLAAGVSVNLVVRGKVNISNGTLLNVVVVTSNTSDFDEDGSVVNHTNKTTNTSVDVDPLANITIVKVSNVSEGATVAYNDFIMFTITVTNNGPDAASDVKVNEILPAGLINITFYPLSRTDYNPDTNVWTIGDLAAGESADLFVRGKVNIINGTLLNVVVVTSNTSDYDEYGNVWSIGDLAAGESVNLVVRGKVNISNGTLLNVVVVDVVVVVVGFVVVVVDVVVVVVGFVVVVVDVVVVVVGFVVVVVDVVVVSKEGAFSRRPFLV